MTFGFDLLTSLGVASAVPYVLVVWLAHLSGGRRETWGVAAGCAVLTLAG